MAMTGCVDFWLWSCWTDLGVIHKVPCGVRCFVIFCFCFGSLASPLFYCAFATTAQHLELECKALIERLKAAKADELATLPPSHVELVFAEITQRLQQNVEEIIVKLINGSEDVGQLFAEQFAQLRERFDATRDESAVIDFSSSFLGSLQPQLEKVFQTLVNVARDHTRRSAASNANTQARPHSVHISRRGSVQITLGTNGTT